LFGLYITASTTSMADPIVVLETSSVTTPDTRGGRSGTLMPFIEVPVLQREEVSQEHLNIPSQERRDLLIELGRALNADEVPASFWACLQVCDLGNLEELVGQAKAAPILASCF